METVRKSLSDLKPNDNNIRKHNVNQVKELVKAIDSFGIIRPIVCDENGMILCGHGLYEALMSKGETHADCIVMSGMTEKQKKKLMLADNKIYELASNNYDMIDSLLKEFGADNDFSIPGYSAETLEDLYGIRSVEESVQQAVESKTFDIPVGDDFQAGENVSEPNGYEPEADPVPSASVQEERAKAMQRRVIVCPHCGGTIEL